MQPKTKESKYTGLGLATFWSTIYRNGKFSPAWCWCGVRALPLSLLSTSTITSKVVVYAPAERADTLLLFLLYPFLLCGCNFKLSNYPANMGGGGKINRLFI